MKKPSVDVIEERLNNVISKLDEISDLIKIQNGRVTALEHFKTKAVAMASGVATIISVSLNYLTKK